VRVCNHATEPPLLEPLSRRCLCHCAMSRSRNFAFTWNNYDEFVEESLRSLDCKYLVAGREVCPTTGTPHLQGTVVFKSAKTLSAAIKALKGAHVAPCRNVFHSIEYCKKDEDELGFFEVGTPPKNQEQKGEDEIARWDLARVAMTEGRFDDIPSDIYIKYNNQCHAVYQRSLEVRHFPDNDVLENYWYWGPSGTGKSSTARRNWPDAFLKMKNKWWNGYTDQEVVIIDDVDPTMENWIGSFLKEWSDHYRFQAEQKGTVRMIRPKIIVVTSQYPIEQIFKDPETISALKRRFHSEHFGSHAFNIPHVD